MTTLEQQCEEIRELWINGDSSTWSSGSIKTLLDYIDELNERLSVCADQEAIDILNAKVYFAEKELAELRRPSDAKEIAQIQGRVDSEYHIYGRESAHADIRTLLHALAESQRECAIQAQKRGRALAHLYELQKILSVPAAEYVPAIQDALKLLDSSLRGERVDPETSNLRRQLDEAQRECARLQRRVDLFHEQVDSIEKQLGIEADSDTKTIGSEIASLSSPPEERRDIQQRQKLRRTGNYNDGNRYLDDIDTLLQDLRKYENAHTILLGERDELRKDVCQYAENTGLVPVIQRDQALTENAKLRNIVQQLEQELDAARDRCERERNAGFVEASRIHGAEIEALRERIEQLEAKCERLDGALQWYADESHWIDIDDGSEQGAKNLFIPGSLITNGHVRHGWLVAADALSKETSNGPV